MGASGTATCTVSYPHIGSHTITAVYSGNPSTFVSGSSSSPLTESVKLAATTLVAAPATSGILSVRFSATLTRSFDGAPLAGRTIAFSFQGQALCQATTNSSGIASCAVTGIVLTLGPVSYTASFAGDDDDLGSAARGNL